MGDGCRVPVSQPSRKLRRAKPFLRESFGGRCGLGTCGDVFVDGEDGEMLAMTFEPFLTWT